MKKVGKFEVYTLDESIDNNIGTIGIERRNKFEEKLKIELLTHRIKHLHKVKRWVRILLYSTVLK